MTFARCKIYLKIEIFLNKVEFTVDSKELSEHLIRKNVCADSSPLELIIKTRVHNREVMDS